VISRPKSADYEGHSLTMMQRIRATPARALNDIRARGGERARSGDGGNVRSAESVEAVLLHLALPA